MDEFYINGRGVGGQFTFTPQHPVYEQHSAMPMSGIKTKKVEPNKMITGFGEAAELDDPVLMNMRPDKLGKVEMPEDIPSTSHEGPSAFDQDLSRKQQKRPITNMNPQQLLKLSSTEDFDDGQPIIDSKEKRSAKARMVPAFRQDSVPTEVQQLEQEYQYRPHRVQWQCDPRPQQWDLPPQVADKSIREESSQVEISIMARPKKVARRVTKDTDKAVSDMSHMKPGGIQVGGYEEAKELVRVRNDRQRQLQFTDSQAEDLPLTKLLNPIGFNMNSKKLGTVNGHYREGEEYTVENFLSRGSFGNVHKIYDVSNKMLLVRKRLGERSYLNPNEVDVPSQYCHDNLAQTVGITWFNGITDIYQEYAGKSFKDAVRDRDFKVMMKESGRFEYIACQLFDGLSFLHKNKITHRDIKPENLCIDPNPQSLCVKIIDLGSCLKPSDDFSFHGTTPEYLPPNVAASYIQFIMPAKNQPVRVRRMDGKDDVWQAMLTLKFLMEGGHTMIRLFIAMDDYPRELVGDELKDTRVEVTKKIARLTDAVVQHRVVPGPYSSFMTTMMSHALAVVPHERATAGEIHCSINREIQRMAGFPPMDPFTLKAPKQNEPVCLPAADEECMDVDVKAQKAQINAAAQMTFAPSSAGFSRSWIPPKVDVEPVQGSPTTHCQVAAAIGDVSIRTRVENPSITAAPTRNFFLQPSKLNLRQTSPAATPSPSPGPTPQAVMTPLGPAPQAVETRPGHEESPWVPPGGILNMPNLDLIASEWRDNGRQRQTRKRKGSST